jgi:hypothetical protein
MKRQRLHPFPLQSDGTDAMAAPAGVQRSPRGAVYRRSA